MLRLLRLSSRIPVRLPERREAEKWLAALVIAAGATLLAIAWRHTAIISGPMGEFEDLLYDSVYRTRSAEDRKRGDIVIVAIDQNSLTKLSDGAIDDVRVAWPWPRELYGDMVQYFEKCGARVVAFDLLFSEIDRNADRGSDETFAEVVNEVNIPVIFGTFVSRDGTPGRFAPPVKDPVFGAVNSEGGVLRYFRPFVHGYPSLAYRLAWAFSGTEPQQKEKFYVHFYGPHRTADGGTTFRYISAFNVLAATRGAEKEAGLSPEVFRDKMVLVGGVAPGLYDEKSVPLVNRHASVPPKLYPGVEWQATATENILFRQNVIIVPHMLAGIVTFVGAFSAAAGSLLPRRTWVKLSWALVTTAAVVALAVGLFQGETIHWLPLAAPLAALLFATIAAFAWSYITEGRARQFLSNAFALSTSPAIAEAIERDPQRMRLGGERREMTVMFTDLAGFTDIAETMDVEKLVEVIQRYMGAMSEVIVQQDGYLDKYIGDAIMCSWNGLVEQPSHAIQACRAALGMKRREVEIAPELQSLVAARIITRIGINTGPMAVGNLGSDRKLQFTVLGDTVNLAARLEPANKLYGTEVVISQTTAEQLNGQFVVRELDLLRVKGKQKPMAVYELVAEGTPDPKTARLIELYAAGLGHYRMQQWDQAEAALRELLERFPTDGPAAAMLRRIGKLRQEELPADWDGVYIATEK